MDKNEAKLTLQSYRGTSEDLNDPAFAEALTLARHDPELAEFLHHDQELDRCFAAKLNQVPVPADLLANIRAGSRPVLIHYPVRKRKFLWALAASLMLLGTLAALWFGRFEPSPGTDLASYQNDMTRFLSRPFLLDLRTSDPTRLQNWLDSRAELPQAAIPGALKNERLLGCRTIEWHGRHIALVCFRANGEKVHLLLTPASDFQTPATAGVSLRTQGSWTTVTWEKDGILYLAASKLPPEIMRSLFAAQPA